MDGSDRLLILLDEIRVAHKEAWAAARMAIDKAREAGKGLIEAKGLLGHGQWLPCLRELGIEPRTAQRYMQLAKMPDDKCAEMAHLGVRAALDRMAASSALAEEPEREPEHPDREVPGVPETETSGTHLELPAEAKLAVAASLLEFRAKTVQDTTNNFFLCFQKNIDLLKTSKEAMTKIAKNVDQIIFTWQSIAKEVKAKRPISMPEGRAITRVPRIADWTAARL